MKQRLLLHLCCANCGTIPIEQLEDKFNLTLFWYNPNITTESEHQKRLKDVKKLATIYNKNLVEEKYEPDQWFKSIQGLEKESEGGKRCEKCVRIRLRKAAQYGKKHGYDCLATSLTTGPQKKAKKINALGKILAKQSGLSFYQADFKKKDGFKKSLALSKKYEFYRQRFCGCAYSIK